MTMSRAINSIRSPRTDEDLARLVVSVELSKLDGAFVLRGDGFIQAAGVFLTSPPAETELVSGLGTRHAAAAAVTMRTAATAIIVSATDGLVQAFSGGKLALQIDPEIAQGHISMDE